MLEMYFIVFIVGVIIGITIGSIITYFENKPRF